MQDAPTLIEQYQRLLRHGDADAARACLALALQVPAYRAEAQLLQGMQAFQGKDYAQAFIQFSQAAQALPRRTEIAALLGKAALAQQQAPLATQLLEAAWRKDPKHTGLRITLWHARMASQPADNTLKQLHTALEYVEDVNELRLVLQLLAQLSPPDSVAGTVQYDAVQGVIHGWAVNLHAPDTPASLQIRVGNRHAVFNAKSPHPLLDKAGWPATHGAFRFKLEPQREPVRILALAQGTDKTHTATELTGSPLALAPILPGVPGHQATEAAQSTPLPDKAAQPATAALSVPAKAGKNPTKNAKPVTDQKRIDVLIPVYDGFDETLACIHSVLRARQANRSQHDLIVLNDASPNARLTQALAQLAQAGKIVHIVRPANLGFIRNMNRGMALHPDRDVVWLNADTQVHGNWLDRLRTAAYASKKTASAAPFTNNGELLSFPESRISHPMPSANELAQLDNLAKKQPATPIPIETGCGFCLYIKRSALDAVGYLDEITLQRGYGEETDWCLRARGLGWQHVAAPNVFVAHQGGVSFKDEKTLRVQHNNDILRKRYPGAQARYEAISRNDPLAPARLGLQRARLAVLPGWMRAYQQEDMQQQENPRTLYICGGLREQAGLPPIEAPLRLSFANKGMLATATLHAMPDGIPLELSYDLPADAQKLVKDLQGLPLESLVYAQTTGCPEALLQLPWLLKLPHSVLNLPLHQATGNAALKPLLDTAQAIYVPYPTMVLAYRKALPHANVTLLPAPFLPRTSTPPNTLPCLLIADTLQHSAAGAHWLEVAHTLAHRKKTYGSAPILLIPGAPPWQEQLLATGIAVPVPGLDVLDMKESLALAGCAVAVSLDSNPDASWLAPVLALHASLPLYAPVSAAALQAGAEYISELLTLAPWLHPSIQTC